MSKGPSVSGADHATQSSLYQAGRMTFICKWVLVMVPMGVVSFFSSSLRSSGLILFPNLKETNLLKMVKGEEPPPHTHTE